MNTLFPLHEPLTDDEVSEYVRLCTLAVACQQPMRECVDAARAFIELQVLRAENKKLRADLDTAKTDDTFGMWLGERDQVIKLEAKNRKLTNTLRAIETELLKTHDLGDEWTADLPTEIRRRCLNRKDHEL